MPQIADRKSMARYICVDKGATHSFYSSIVSKIILHLDTHIDIKLRNGQTL